MSAAPPIPIVEASALLRRLGLALVEAVVRRAPAPALARLVSRREVALLLPFAGRRGAVPLTAHTIGPWLREQSWFAGRGLGRSWVPPQLEPALQRSSQRALECGAAAQVWEQVARAWVDRALGGISPRWLAEPFWELAGEAAWGHAALQAEVAHLLIGELRTRVLFTPGEPPAPLIAPRTYWALIAMADVGRPALWRLLLRRRAARRGLRRLQQTAARLALAPGWADVWDQWLLSEALRLWDNAAGRPTPELQRAMLAMPLHLRLNQPAAAPEAASVELAVAGWEQRVPPWLATLARWDREPPAAQP
jgi:hypothetical protein